MSTSWALWNNFIEHILKQSKFSKNQIVNLCKNGEKVLFVRHPILRLISAWNDKFRLDLTTAAVSWFPNPKTTLYFSVDNNFVNHGLKYGMNLLQNWQKSFPEDHKFMHYQLKQKGEIMHWLLHDNSDSPLTNRLDYFFNCELISNKGTKDKWNHYWFKKRDWKENPGHLIDFSDLVTFIIRQNPQKLDAHFR